MIGALRTPQDDRWYRLALGGLIVGAWGALLLWGASPYAELLGHGEGGAAPGDLTLRLPLFVVGWILMTVAMMLPGSLPLVNLFRRMILDRPERGRLLARLLLGYLAVWGLFGLVAYLADVGLHALVAWSAPARSSSARSRRRSRWPPASTSSRRSSTSASSAVARRSRFWSSTGAAATAPATRCGWARGTGSSASAAAGR